ncbi:MAG: hypothetical protein ACYCSF_07330 [Acidimicrobiales bacterium]
MARLRGESFVGLRAPLDPAGDGELSPAADETALRPPVPGSGERDFVLRTLRVLGDAVSFELLACCRRTPRSTAYLAGAMALPLSAVWERVNDLIQVGLLERSLESDSVAMAPAGHTVLEIVDALTLLDGAE